MCKDAAHTPPPPVRLQCRRCGQRPTVFYSDEPWRGIESMRPANSRRRTRTAPVAEPLPEGFTNRLASSISKLLRLGRRRAQASEEVGLNPPPPPSPPPTPPQTGISQRFGRVIDPPSPPPPPFSPPPSPKPSPSPPPGPPGSFQEGELCRLEPCPFVEAIVTVHAPSQGCAPAIRTMTSRPAGPISPSVREQATSTSRASSMPLAAR